MYGELAKDFCLLEAGYISQLLMETSSEQEIGLCPIGVLKFEELRDPFGLEESQILLHSFVGGKIDVAWTKQWLQPAVSESQKPVSIADELRHLLQQKLPNYMVPSAYMLLDTFPLTANGKVDRKALPVPRRNFSSHESAGYVGPQTYLEYIVANVWQERLQLEKVGIHDNFFELGGDSLLATRVISQVSKILKMELPIKIMFEAPTVSGISKQIEAICPTVIQKLANSTSEALVSREEGIL